MSDELPDAAPDGALPYSPNLEPIGFVKSQGGLIRLFKTSANDGGPPLYVADGYAKGDAPAENDPGEPLFRVIKANLAEAIRKVCDCQRTEAENGERQEAAPERGS